MSRLYDDMRDFLVLHYTGDRNDTSFWKFIKTKEHITPLVKNMIEYSKHSIPDFNTMPFIMVILIISFGTGHLLGLVT